jgi:hypothetical protein
MFKRIARIAGYIGFGIVVIVLSFFVLCILSLPVVALWVRLYPVISYWTIPVIICIFGVFTLMIYGMILLGEEDKKCQK